jgi:hypothetical protein
MASQPLATYEAHMGTRSTDVMKLPTSAVKLHIVVVKLPTTVVKLHTDVVVAYLGSRVLPQNCRHVGRVTVPQTMAAFSSMASQPLAYL